ncbi:MAG: HMA2 domain-containing protein [Treponema sp.]
MISSFFPGRVRLRAPIFKDTDIVQAAKDIITSAAEVKNAVKTIDCNLTTGSVLICYDPFKLPMERLQPLIPFLQKLHDEAKHYTPSKKTHILALLEELRELLH